MRSAAALVALALVGSVDLVAAGLCKPDTRDNTETGSATTTPGSTTTAAPRTVRNVVRNGNFEGYDPSYDGGIYAFQAQNEARLVEGPGYQGDGSKESNCVHMEARNTGSATHKRDIAEFAAIEQQLDAMDTTSLYTIRFYYQVLQNDIADTCKFDVYYGDELFTSSPYFPVALPTDSNPQWESVVDQAAVETSSGLMRIDLNCASGGYAEVYVDQVFVSNEVSPDNMDNISLLYTWAYSSTSTTQKATTSSTEVTTTQDSTTSTTSTTLAVSTTTTTTSTSTTQSTTSSTSAAATSTGNRYCVTLGSTGDPGRGCGLRPYNPSTGYKTISSTRMTRDQCGALCFADANCQQFQWDAYSSSYACLNTCILLSSNLASTSANNGGAYYAYDRSCITQKECTAQPDGTTCVNGLGDTPGAGCRSRVTGTVKSCSAAFLTASVGFICDPSKECRDLCAKYPDCKSYSINFAGSCSLYPGTISEIVDESTSGQFFYDMSCSECGSGDLGYFNYVTQLQTDVSAVNECPAATSVTSSSSILSTTSTSTSASTSSSVSSNIDITTTPGASTTPSTTTSSTSTTSYSCPAGISYPGACYSATPTSPGSICGERGDVPLTDAYGVSSKDWAQNSVRDCALYCELQGSQCSAYGWSDEDTAGMPCRFIHDSVTASGFSEDSSWATTWYDMGCVTCIMCEASSTATSTTSAATSTSTCALNNGEGCTSKILVEAGYYCNQAGTVQEDAYAYSNTDYPFQGSAKQCAAICAQKTGCKASSYDSSRSLFQCAFISSSLQSAGFSASSGSSKWSDQACWDCPSCSGAGSSTSASSTSASSTPGASTPGASISSASTPDASTPTASTTFATSTLRPETTPGDDTSSTTSTTSQTSSTSTTSQAAVPTSCVATVSLTDDVTCGLPGTGGNQAQSNYLMSYVIKPVANLSACGQICLDRTDCLGFQYVSDTKVCYPYRIGTSGLGLTYVSSSKSRFYDRDCYICG